MNNFLETFFADYLKKIIKKKKKIKHWKNTYDDSYTANNLVLEEKINCTGNMPNGKTYRSIRHQLINTVLNVKANCYKLKLEDNFGDCKNLWGAIISVLNRRDDDLN